MENGHKGFETAGEALNFIFGGNATFTITSAVSDKHFTYKVKLSDDAKLQFVSVLNGPDNWENYLYIGFVPASSYADVKLVAGKKGRPDAPSFKALTWVLSHLSADSIPADLSIQHEGKCCMCNRKLTDPISIERGVGPDCYSRM